jgi:hypothetical protein
VPADAPTVLATSGGYVPAERHRLDFGPLVHHAVELSGVTGRAPRVCHIGTAVGDQRWFNAELVEAVTEVPGRGAYLITRDASGAAVEEPLVPRSLDSRLRHQTRGPRS